MTEEYEHRISRDDLGDADRETQLDVMRTWFRENYEDPAERTPYESKEGGYIWIWGGPYDAREELSEKFGGVVPDDVIEELVDELQQECLEWAPTEKPEDYEDYDAYLVDDIAGIGDHYENFCRALADIRKLLKTSVDDALQRTFHRLLYVNVITAMETYLSDAFIGKVVPDKALTQKLVETTPEFKSQKVPLSEVYKAAGEMDKRVKSHLADVVWHRLDRVKPMYLETLGVSFPEQIGGLYKAIDVRHHIVHRNGKTKDGEEVVVTPTDVEQLVVDVETFVKHVHDQLVKQEFPTLGNPDEGLEF